MKAIEQYKAIKKFLSANDGTNKLFIPGSLRKGTIKLLIKNGIHINIEEIKIGYFILKKL
jgi:hypothetical protein